MKRNRTKSSPPRLTRDAEQLVALSRGLATSGSHLEDRFWDAHLDLQLIRLLDHSSDSALEHALDFLYSSQPMAYDVLIDAAEAQAESLQLGADAVLLVAAPVLAWSKYSIFSGPLRPDVIEALTAELYNNVAAHGTRLAVAPHLYSIDQLPQRFSKTRALARELGQRALGACEAAASKRSLPSTAPLLADTRYVLGVIAAPVHEPLFVWQESATERGREAVSREQSLERWRAGAGALLAGVLTGCSTELMLPDAYHLSCRESDRAVRPFGIRAAIAFLEAALSVEATQLRAVVALFGDVRGEEYRIGFTHGPSNDVLHGVVWPLYGREEGPEAEGPRDQIEALLKECLIPDVAFLDQLFPLEFCEDCGAPLFADATGELVHPELPEDAEQPKAHLH
jgi:hypothetical protein